jgi:hypothetical protein
MMPPPLDGVHNQFEHKRWRLSPAGDELEGG